MLQEIETAYQKFGPCLSSQIQDFLVSQGKSPVAARQAISRFRSKLHPINIIFPHNERFICTKNDFGSNLYLESLRAAILTERTSCYALALRALEARGGLIPKSHFLIACGSPLSQKKHVSIDTLLTRLIDSNLIEEFDSDLLGNCIQINGCNTSKAELETYARISAEKILINCIHDWIINLNIASYEKIQTRNNDKLPQFGTFNWDIAGPSYLYALCTGDGSSDCGFVAGDVLFKYVTKDTISPFLNKFRMISSLKKIRKCLYIFIAEEYDHETFQILKSVGIIPATIKNLFGQELAHAMKNLCDVLSSMVASTDNKEKLKNVFDKIGRIEGAALSLRGALFPFIVAETLKADSFEILKMNKKIVIPGSFQKHEIDIIAKKSNEIYFFECKGEKPESQADDEEISKWIKSLPHAKAFADEYPEYHGKSFHYEIWTSGFFSDDAIKELMKIKSTLRKYAIDYKCGRDILQLAKRLNITHIVDTLNEHFFKHPLAKRRPSSPSEELQQVSAANESKY